MCGDLWEVAVNCHPRGLSELRGKSSKDEQKSLPLWLIAKHGYNLSGVMGTVLKEQMHFDRLETISENYERAFYKDHDLILSVFKDDPICSLSAVRNLLVHRAGVIDERYLNRTKKLVLAPKGAINEPIQLDGEIVHKLTTAAIVFGCALLNEVDKWLVAHK
jgi:hypothetical protein